MSPSWIWSDKITNERVARVGYNHVISNKGEWNNCFSKFSNRVLPQIFISTILQRGKFLNLAHYFPCDVKLRILAHSRSFLANQKARNAIVGAVNLLSSDISPWTLSVSRSSQISSSYALGKLFVTRNRYVRGQVSWHIFAPNGGYCLFIIHQIFSLALDWSKRVTWANIPQLKLGNIWKYSPIFKTARFTKKIWRIINTIASIWGENMRHVELSFFPLDRSTSFPPYKCFVLLCFM